MSASSLKEAARAILKTFVVDEEKTGENIAIDVLRVLHNEAQLLYETQCIRDMFDQDPFECYKNDANLQQLIKRFQESLQVTSCHRVEMANNYCLTEAVIQYNEPRQTLSPFHKKQKLPFSDPLKLHFKYEREPASASTATSIWYSIDLSRGHGPKESLVVIRVWADDNKPSKLPALSVDEAENDDEWEDIDESDDVEAKQANLVTVKGIESDENEKDAVESQDSNAGNDESSRDRYACYVDPDILRKFLETTQLTSLDEATSFFTLMTFPYYQHEWDLVGFVLDSVFGHDDEDSSDE